jgi:hypothetical protein
MESNNQRRSQGTQCLGAYCASHYSLLIVSPTVPFFMVLRRVLEPQTFFLNYFHLEES